MDEVNPIIIFLMFIGRCLVPLFIMLGISYVLKRLGLIKEPPTSLNGAGRNGNQHASQGDLLHGKS